MIRNNTLLFHLTVAFVVTVTIYNCMVIYVTKYLSSIWHAILDNFRPITIWSLDLALYYVIVPGQGFGESWLGLGSWLQLFGLLVLFIGTAIYNGTIGDFGDEKVDYLPISDIDEPYINNPNNNKKASNMSSPSMTRSPLIYKPKPDKK